MISFNRQETIKLFEAGNFAGTSKALLQVLYDLQQPSEESITPEEAQTYEDYARTLMELFCQENYHIPENYWPLFLKHSCILSNLVSVTPYKTTDKAISIIINQKHNFIKLLILYSHRNKIDLDVSKFFEINGFLASCWWSNMIDNARFCQVSEHSYNKLCSFLNPPGLHENLDLMMMPDRSFLSDNYYGAANYIDVTKDEVIRKAVNYAFKKKNLFGGLKIDLGKADFKKIAVVSRAFHMGNAAYKSLGPMYKSLKDDYDITLISTSRNPGFENNIDRDLFKEVIFLCEDERVVIPNLNIIQELADKNFGTIFYAATTPDLTTVALANERLAPIQISNYGNPLRTEEIDFFIGSEAVEPEEKIQYYNEKPVLIPGNAIMAEIPEIDIKPKESDENVVAIACSWGNGKTTFGHLKLLKEVQEKSSKKLKLMFVGVGNVNFYTAPFRRELDEIFGEGNIETYPNKSFAEYIQHIADSDIGIDSYPFGSYNRIIDSLLCGKPIVAMEGDRSFNRLAQALLKHLDLGDELVAKSEAEFATKTLKLIEDNQYRKQLSEKILKMDLKTMVEDGNEKYFKVALDRIIVEYEDLKNSNQDKIIIRS